MRRQLQFASNQRQKHHCFRIRELMIAIVVVLPSVISPVGADDWGAPPPVSFNSRGFGYVAEIFPPGSRQNATNKPICYFYEMGYPEGTTWTIHAKLLWKAPLVNAQMPYEAVVSMQGRLVTLNDYGALGYKNAVAVYSKTGNLVKTYQLDELIPASDRREIETSISSRWWNKEAKYYFLKNPERLYIVLSWGKVVKVDLDSGRHRYGTSAQFRDLGKVMANGKDTNEETRVWATSLRFSSVTDLMALRILP